MNTHLFFDYFLIFQTQIFFCAQSSFLHFGTQYRSSDFFVFRFRKLYYIGFLKIYCLINITSIGSEIYYFIWGMLLYDLLREIFLMLYSINWRKIIVFTYWDVGQYGVRCAIWCHLYNLKNVKHIHGGMLILVKLQAETCNFTKVSTPLWVFFTFFKLYKWYQIAQHITYGLCNSVFLSLWRHSFSKYPKMSGQTLKYLKKEKVFNVK